MIKLAAWLVSLGVLLASCGRSVTEGSFPVSFVEKGPFSLSVHPSDGVESSDLVDLGIFGDFRPGIDGKEAVRRFGKPHEYRDNGNILAYKTPRGRIEVAYLTERSDGMSRSKWYLIAVPNPTENLLDREVERHVSRSMDEIFILGNDDRTRVQVKLEEGRVSRLVWLRE